MRAESLEDVAFIRSSEADLVLGRRRPFEVGLCSDVVDSGSAVLNRAFFIKDSFSFMLPPIGELV